MLPDVEVIVLDLDGTLLTSRGVISSRTKEAIRKCFQQGYQLVVATGRNYREAKSIMEQNFTSQELISSFAYITCNGGNINYKGENLFNNQFSADKCLEMIDFLENEIGLSYLIYTPEEILTTSKNKWKYLKFVFLGGLGEEKGLINKLIKIGKSALRFRRSMKIFPFKIIDSYADYINKKEASLQKLFIFGEEHSIKEAKNKLMTDKKVKLSNWEKRLLETNPKGTSKGAALSYLTKQWDISLEKAIAFGDGGNDLEMMEEVGFGIAMENSEVSELKEKADLIAASNDQEGVALVLEELLKRRK